jgi:archaellum component FlaC
MGELEKMQEAFRVLEKIDERLNGLTKMMAEIEKDIHKIREDAQRIAKEIVA